MPREKKPQFFVPEADALTRAANAGYLAALLDRGHVGTAYSKKKDHNPLHVVITLGESHDEARKTWQFIVKNWDLKKALIRVVDLFKSKSFDLLKETGFQSYKRETVYLTISDPESVLKLLKSALPFSERPERLKKVIEAADYLIRKSEPH